LISKNERDSRAKQCDSMANSCESWYRIRKELVSAASSIYFWLADKVEIPGLKEELEEIVLTRTGFSG